MHCQLGDGEDAELSKCESGDWRNLTPAEPSSCIGGPTCSDYYIPVTIMILPFRAAKSTSSMNISVMAVCQWVQCVLWFILYILGVYDRVMRDQGLSIFLEELHKYIYIYKEDILGRHILRM